MTACDDDPYARSVETLLDDAALYACLRTGAPIRAGMGPALLDFLDSTGYVVVKAETLVPDTVPADLCGETS